MSSRAQFQDAHDPNRVDELTLLSYQVDPPPPPPQPFLVQFEGLQDPVAYRGVPHASPTTGSMTIDVRDDGWSVVSDLVNYRKVVVVDHEEPPRRIRIEGIRKHHYETDPAGRQRTVAVTIMWTEADT